jgi:hypothetical protein
MNGLTIILSLLGTFALIIYITKMHFFNFVIKLALKEMIGKKVGFKFTYDIAGNIRFPDLIELKDIYYEQKDTDESWVFSEDQFKKGRFLGYPYAIYNQHDAKTTMGFSYQLTDEKGLPLYEEKEISIMVGKDKNGKPVFQTKKELVPVYTHLKNSVSLPPKLLKAIVGAKAVSQVVNDIIGDNQRNFYLLLGSIVIAGGTAYFIYQLKNGEIATILQLLQNLQALVPTTEVLTNATNGNLTLPLN